MGLKNELLDLKERLNTAWEAEDLDSIEEIVSQWLDEGWTMSEIRKRFEEWLSVDEFNFREVMFQCGFTDV